MHKGTYFSDLREAVQTSWGGLSLTLKHLWQSRRSKASVNIASPGYFDRQHGIATIQYPHETIPVPDVGRYQLHNEIDDCIVCDKCAKICPVDCITIEPIKSPEEFGRTSDGTPKRIYAAKFDIDMGKCCFCGLCTTVCPTECLTMTKEYDFSVFNIREHNFAFGNLTAAEIEAKEKQWAHHQATKAQQAAVTQNTPAAPPPTSRPAFKPRIKPPESNA
jgi:formate hydrogenlyase subunit 6/NADH:ubiquinone oxidoreductase subunit I